MSLKAFVVVTSVFACGPVLACTQPYAPRSLPDGKTAAKDLMLAKKREVDAYRREVEQYLACERNPTKMRAAQAELDRVANRFNAEVRAFKAVNSD